MPAGIKKGGGMSFIIVLGRLDLPALAQIVQIPGMGPDSDDLFETRLDIDDIFDGINLTCGSRYAIA